MFLYLRKLGNNDEPISSAIWHNLTGAIVFFIIFLFLQPNFYFDFHIYILLALIGIILSFTFSFLTIKFFMKFIRNFSLNIFVLYRIILSLVLFYIIYS